MHYWFIWKRLITCYFNDGKTYENISECRPDIFFVNTEQAL
jgi:hypothetical protein